MFFTFLNSVHCHLDYQAITSRDVFTCKARCSQLWGLQTTTRLPQSCSVALCALQDRVCHCNQSPSHHTLQRQMRCCVSKSKRKNSPPAAVLRGRKISLAHLQAWIRCWCHPAEWDDLCCSTDGFYRTAADYCRELLTSAKTGSV